MKKDLLNGHSRASQTGWYENKELERKMSIDLTTDQAELLVAAAHEAQNHRRDEVKAMPFMDAEKNDIMHLEAKIQRTDQALRELERKITFYP